MKLLRGLQVLPEFSAGVVAVIGNFDGVHRGHQSLLKLARARAHQCNKPLMVIVFEPQAREFFTPDKAPVRLFKLREKIHFLRKLGVDFVYCLTFNNKLAAMSALDFADNILKNRLHVVHLLIGEDFCFGRGRTGDLKFLQAWGLLRQVAVEVYPAFFVAGIRVSSTLIRQKLIIGDVTAAAVYLGRNYGLYGRVVSGRHLARLLGFPTANLQIYRNSLPTTGVFCVRVRIATGKWFNGVANSGTRPTVCGMTPLIEVHLFDFTGSLYGQILYVEFLHKLRDEQTFPHVDALIAQIKQDVQAAQMKLRVDVMTDYKHTLNLPQTDFPMKANLSEREPKRLAKWQQHKIYAAIRDARHGKPKFILHDGPPYANGHLHCGHALNKILKDIILKSKSFSGFDAPFVPGWDCHGLPIELNVEKKIGKAGVKVTAKEFRQACRDYATSQIAIQSAEFQRLGVFGDWQQPYATMQFTYEANIIRALASIIDKGHLHQGFKPVYWCVDCASSLAEAEVEYEEKQSASIDVAFIAKDGSQVLQLYGVIASEKPVVVPIWTTTPWTLPANEAVCLHATLDYTLVETTDQYLVIATELLDTVLARYGIVEYTLQGSVAGIALEHILLQHPLYQDTLVPIVLGPHVSVDAGTGCVHTAPAHGLEDYLVGLSYQLPLKNPVLANGCYAADVPLFAGLFVLKAHNNIISVLQESGVLLAATTIKHSYPHCWRHKTPVIYRATPQWFIAMDKAGLRTQLMTQIETVQFVPDWGKARMLSMVADRPDWCISRQRAWGTPIPLFVHKTTRQLHPRTVDLMQHVANLVAESGIEAWFQLDPVSLLGDEADLYDKGQDTLDVWFDAGVSHFCVLQQQEALGMPADVYFEGSDQYRGWFNSSLTTAVALNGVAPYKTILTHGYTVDAAGKKLSKSQGNYVALDVLIAKYGADVIRLWVASSDYRYELSISDEIMQRTSDAYRRIRNTARFLLANLVDFDSAVDKVEAGDFVEIDRYIVQRAILLQEEILLAYEQYNFHVIYQLIHNFCVVDLGGFYLDIIKDRQYTTAKNSTARRSCQTAMYHVIMALVRWLAPIISFTAEEIWEFIPGAPKTPLFIEQWYKDWPQMTPVDMTTWSLLQEVRDEVNKALELQRTAGVIGSALAACVDIYAPPELLQILERLGDELRFVLITSNANVYPLATAPVDLPIINGLGIVVSASTHEKCARCWHRDISVGTIENHPTLCKRCLDNIDDCAEARCFV